MSITPRIDKRIISLALTSKKTPARLTTRGWVNYSIKSHTFHLNKRMTAFMPVSVLNQNRMGFDLMLFVGEDPFISIDDAFRRQQAVADIEGEGQSLGKRRGQNSFGNLLLKVGIYPRHWYSYSLNYTCFRELNVFFLWVAYVNISQEQGFRKIKFDIASALIWKWKWSETGCKQDPKTFQSSSNLDIKVKWYLGLLNRFSFESGS